MAGTTESAGAARNWAKTKAYRQLRDSLFDSLARKGLDETAYRDKVDEYMDFWVQRQNLEADIRARGVSVLDAKRGMMVENRSVSLSVQVSRQMLAIFKALGLQDDACSAAPPEDDDDAL